MSNATQSKTILHLCADTGSDTRPYRDAGYNVILVGSAIGVENYHSPNNVYGIIANPVCTEFSVANGWGKSWNIGKGMFLVDECLRIVREAKAFGTLAFWALENPATGRLREELGTPTMSYEPWEFGSPWTKRTALWGQFNAPEKVYSRFEDVPKLVLPTYQGRQKPSLAKLHKNHAKLIPEFSCFAPQSDMEFRSLCSQKFAQAFYECNK